MGNKTAAQMVAEARATIENLSPDEVEAELKHGNALLVDIRGTDERAAGAIPNSLHAPRGKLEFLADPASPMHKPELDPARRIILHCASGARSALATITLRQLGFGNVAHLGGGYKAWVEAGKPVTK